MKFDKLLNYALEHGYEWVLTGNHYARIEPGENGRWLLKKALDPAKDQRLMCSLQPDAAPAGARAVSAGRYVQPDVRKLAEEYAFVNARKHDSQGHLLCARRRLCEVYGAVHPAKHYPAGIFWTKPAAWWGSTGVLCAIRWASARELGLPWGAGVCVREGHGPQYRHRRAEAPCIPAA